MTASPLVIPFIPDTAPFNEVQRAWLNGFLAGLYQGQGEVLPPGPPPAAPASITVLYGTQTGTAAALSRSFAKEFGKRGFASKAIDLAEFKVSQLEKQDRIVLITSTYGDGEPPDGARSFYTDLHAESAPRLDHLEFSVLGLGDKNYEKFCACAVEIDQRLEKLGAKRIFERMDCDVDYEKPARDWLESILSVWKEKAAVEAAPVDLSPVEDQKVVYDKNHPFEAQLLDNRLLNSAGSAKETRHLAFSLLDSGLSYSPGDALGVLPVNSGKEVDEMLALLGCDGEEGVKGPGGEEKSLRLALLRDFEIGSINRSVLENFAHQGELEELHGLFDPARTVKLNSFLKGRRWTDLLAQYGWLKGRPLDILPLLRRLQPRLYSIASSAAAHPGEVHLCVGVLRYQLLGGKRQGVCSSYLAERIEKDVRVFIHENQGFRLPAPEKAVIMIGPGTGIAPFRAFLEERRATGAPGRNWLFFGDQHESSDFLYRDEMEGFRRDGILNRLSLAFSRDQNEKIYVQNRMEEEGREFWNWLQDGAFLYVCGDASRMAKDVDSALHKIIRDHGNKSELEAKAFVELLKKDRRYQRDVY